MMEFLQPPPTAMNFNVPPPSLQPQPPSQQQPPPSQPAPPMSHYPRERHYHGFSGKSGQHFRPYNNFGRGPGGMPISQDDFDGKRLRKSVMRKTVDYNSSIVRALEVRIATINNEARPNLLLSFFHF